MPKATITALDGDKPTKDASRRVEVQFNPQTLQVTYRTHGNSGAENAKGASQTQTQASRNQTTGFSSSLSMDLLFDTTEKGTDVRAATDILARIMGADQGRPGPTAPAVQFQWGTFIFNGTIDSLIVTLDFFSENGLPLRASVRLSMSGIQLEPAKAASASAGSGAGASQGLGVSAGASFGASAGFGANISASANLQTGANFGASVGTTPLTLAQEGDSLQGLAGRAGLDWKAVATANNVENPRLLNPGAVLNLNVRVNKST